MNQTNIAESGKKKILIVDDSASLRESIKQTLEDADTIFIECDDGADAFDLYKENIPDWVLMDIQMKKVDGITAARQIRNTFPESNIIFVTQYDNIRLREIAKSIGGNGYVLKQNLFDLREIINNSNYQEL